MSDKAEKDDYKLIARTKWNCFWGYPGALALVVFILDQLTKWLIYSQTYLGWYYEVIPNFFNLVQVRNPGAAWGIFGEHTWALGLLSLVCFAALVFFFDGLTGRKTMPSLLFGCLAGGIVGNMVDRVFRGYVIDFLDFHWYETYHYPSFNVADIGICVAVFLLLVCSFLEGRGEKKKGKNTEKEG